jgi:cobyrinic acid a,c-diamide synthase
VLQRDDRLQWRDRHLGLIPVVERSTEVRQSIELLAELMASSCDIATIAELAGTAPIAHTTAVSIPASISAAPVRVAVAAGPAFSFTYPDNLEALAAAGAELVPFDPCSDTALPQGCGGLLAGGGFPEVYAEQLSANAPLLADVRRQVTGGLTTWAECGGLLWLCDELDGRPMAGAVRARAQMTTRLTLGYRIATTTTKTPLGPAGTAVRGHEFHYSTTDPAGPLFELTGRHGTGSGGFGNERLVASYLHTHLGARPDLATHFVSQCSALCMPYMD